MIHTSAPATLMLMGEHAVLHGKHALAASLNQRLHIYLKMRQDRIIRIDSALGQFEFSLDQIELQAPFQFILSLIKQLQTQLPTGFDLKIDSEFSSTIGLGSSAAVLTATTLALLQFAKIQYDDQLIFKTAYQSLMEVQGCGSGADLAASITGGIICYQQTPLRWEKLNIPLFPIILVYAGYKTPTPQVIEIVNVQIQQNPEKFQRIFAAIDEATLFAKEALLADDQAGWIYAFQTNQNLMAELGIVDSALQEIVHLLKQNPQILAAKVSGSGLGDCVLGLGKTRDVGHYTVLDVALSKQGLYLHDDSD